MGLIKSIKTSKDKQIFPDVAMPAGSVLSDDDASATTGVSVPPGGMQSDMIEPIGNGSLFVDFYPMAGSILGIGNCSFTKCRSQLDEKLLHLVHLFGSDEERELATWLHESGLFTSKIDQFFKLSYVHCSFMSFSNILIL